MEPAEHQIRALRPATAAARKSQPSSVRTTWRALPLLLAGITGVPAPVRLPSDKLDALRLAFSVNSPVDVDQDVPWSAEYLVVPVRRRINHEPWVLYPTNELAHRDLSLQPRKRATET